MNDLGMQVSVCSFVGVLTFTLATTLACILATTLAFTLNDVYKLYFYIGLDKGRVFGKYFSYFSTKTYVVGTH